MHVNPAKNAEEQSRATAQFDSLYGLLLRKETCKISWRKIFQWNETLCGLVL
jgi:hypothetical protein